LSCGFLLNSSEATKILHLLKTQNVGLKTEEWKIVNSQVEPLGVTLVLDTDETSLKALSGMGFKPYLGFSQLTFKVLGWRSEHAAGNLDKPAA
jgi:hypothetical protein